VRFIRGETPGWQEFTEEHPAVHVYDAPIT
jgi:hypothetical protein